MDIVVARNKTLQKQDSKLTPVRLPKVKLWTRLSPLHLFRVFRDSYVRGCVTFGNSSKVNAVAHTSAFQIACDDNTFSRSNSRNIASAQELLDISSKLSRQGSVQESIDLSSHFSRQISEQEAVQSGRKHRAAFITGQHGLTMEDLQGHSGPLRKTGASGLDLTDVQGYSGPLRGRPSFDAVPESEQYTDSNRSKIALETLFQTSALHPTDFLQSSSRRVAALESYQVSHLPPRNFDLTRGGSDRRPVHRPHARNFSSASVSHVTALSANPLSPVTDLSSFREQSNGRKSYDLPRASSRRRERFGSMNSTGGLSSFGSLKSSGSLRGPADLIGADFPRSRSRKALNRPNPYREYDTRAPSPTPTV